MANPNDIQRLLAGDKDLQGADLSRFNFGEEVYINRIRGVDFRGADFTGSLLQGFDCVKCDFRGAKFYGTSFGYNTFHKCDFRDVEFNSSWGRDVDFQGSDLEGASGIPFKTLYGLANDGKHKGETVEEKVRREEEERNRKEKEERLRKEEERIRKEEERIRRKTIQDVTKRVSRAKKDKELEALAQEVGSLQAQSDYVKEYGKDLNDLQTKIEEKYSVIGKGIIYLKKLFSKGRRASQIRTASQMLKQLNKEIADLKKEL